jgi:cobalt/nickel transport system permease protein
MSDLHIHQNPRGNFIEHTIEGLHAALARAMYAETLAGRSGLLQGLDPRVKVAGLLALILATALSLKLWVIAAILLTAVVLVVASALPVGTIAPVWLSVLTFTGVIAFPAIFLTPGATFYKFPNIAWPITTPGITSASFLILRAETSATLAMLLVFTTPWTHVLKALRTFRVPIVFVVALGMTFRYILLLLETAREMFESRKSRTVGKMNRADYRRLAISSGGVLLGKSFQLSSEVFLAMQARGFRGEVYVLDDFSMTPRDWEALAFFGALTAACIWAGR